jgi:mono/diheme cytochrome c family protein
MCGGVALALGLAASASLAGIEEGDVELGRNTYNKLCATCHGPAGDGQGPVGKTLVPPPRDFTAGDFKYGGTDEDLYTIITQGAAVKGGSPLMAAWGNVKGVQTEKERWSLVKYIRSLKKEQ